MIEKQVYCKGHNDVLGDKIGIDCPLRENCLRFKEEKDKGDIFFDFAPFRRIFGEIKCGFYKPINKLYEQRGEKES